tara:strand:- start:742 stop:1545 length:804 start_codon:yes stop_codon:yes gene_type:complete
MDKSIHDTIECWKTKLDRPLVILGIHGSGKTQLANQLLSDYTVIRIDETVKNPQPYIDSALNRKDVSMMFTKKRYKAILFDDSIDINNSIISNIVKKKYKNTPIIITSSNIYTKVKTTKYYIVKLSKKNKYKTIQKNFKKYNFNEYEYQYNTIGLNILNNIDNLEKDKILKIYSSLCIYDIYERNRSIDIFKRTDYSILFSCIIPIFYTGKMVLTNNSYLSKSIIITNLTGIIGDKYESYYIDYLINKPLNKKVNNLYKRLINVCQL